MAHCRHARGVQDSLANTTNGTTFAAKARAAELNAVRSRKAAKALADEAEEPVMAPVSVMTFTKRGRNRAGWKTLDQIQSEEESSLCDQHPTHAATASTPRHQQGAGHRDDSSGQTLTPSDGIKSRVPSYQAYLSGEPVDQASNYSSLHTEKSQTRSLNLDECDPNMPPSTFSGYESHDRVSQHSSRATSMLGQTVSPYSSEINRGGRNFSTYSQASAPNHGGSVHQSPHSQTQVGTPEGLRLPDPGSVPQSKTSTISSGPQMVPASEDPFSDHPQFTSTMHQSMSAYGPQTDSKPRAAVRMPPAVKGTSGHDFRFPSANQHLQENRPPKSNDVDEEMVQALARDTAEKGQLDRDPYLTQYDSTLLNSQTNSRYNSLQVSSTNSMVRDPLPYTGFSAGSKKDMLLQSLDRVVETSKAMGDLPSSTRTVLYDPLARESSRTPSILTGSTLKAQAPCYPYASSHSKIPLDVESDR